MGLFLKIEFHAYKHNDLVLTNYISNSTAITEPPIRQSITKVNTIPRQVCLGKAST